MKRPAMVGLALFLGGCALHGFVKMDYIDEKTGARVVGDATLVTVHGASTPAEAHALVAAYCEKIWADPPMMQYMRHPSAENGKYINTCGRPFL